MYTIRLERQARKALAALPQPDYGRISAAIRALAQNPRPQGCRKLSGYDAWRIRVGNYRVIYEINDGDLIVIVVDIGHRRDVYR